MSSEELLNNLHRIKELTEAEDRKSAIFALELIREIVEPTIERLQRSQVSGLGEK